MNKELEKEFSSEIRIVDKLKVVGVNNLAHYSFVVKYKHDIVNNNKILFIDNKIPYKERQKAIIGEQDGQIIFLYVSGRLYLKKKPENAILYGTVVIYKNF